MLVVVLLLSSGCFCCYGCCYGLLGPTLEAVAGRKTQSSFVGRLLLRKQAQCFLPSSGMDDRRHDCSVSFLGSSSSNADISPQPTRATISFAAIQSRNLISVAESLELFHLQQHHLPSSSSKDASMPSSPPTSRRTLHFMDGSWYHKGNRNGRLEFCQGPRIPHSVFFDMNDISSSSRSDDDPSTTRSPPSLLSHMQPSPRLFAAYMDACHIQPHDCVIVYGGSGCAFLPRVWFTLRHVMGHVNVRLMQGSIQEWIEAGGAVEYPKDDITASISSSAFTSNVTSTTTNKVAESPEHYRNYIIPWAKDLDLDREPLYQAKYNPTVIVSGETMQSIVASSTRTMNGTSTTTSATTPTTSTDTTSTLIVDTRGSSFHKDGHMPGAIHIPYSSLHDPVLPNRLLQPIQTLRDILRRAGIRDCNKTADDEEKDNSKNYTAGNSQTYNNQELQQQVVVTCGSGVSVCNFVLAMDECGMLSTIPTTVYDGSWEEWAKMDHVASKVATTTAL